MIVEYISLLIVLVMALGVAGCALLFAWKKQELGAVYLRFGPPVNAGGGGLFVALVTQVPSVFFNSEPEHLPVYGVIFGAAMLGAIYLSFQKKAVAEGGMILPPFHVFRWEEIVSYRWEKPPGSPGAQVLFLAVRRTLPLFRRVAEHKVDIPGEHRQRTAELLRLYLPFKEAAG